MGTRRLCRVLTRYSPETPHNTKRPGPPGTMGTRWVRTRRQCPVPPGTHHAGNPTAKGLGSPGTMRRRWVLTGNAGYSPGQHQENPTVPKDWDHWEPWAHAGYSPAKPGTYREPPVTRRQSLVPLGAKRTRRVLASNAGYPPGTHQETPQRRPQTSMTPIQTPHETPLIRP